MSEQNSPAQDALANLIRVAGRREMPSIRRMNALSLLRPKSGRRKHVVADGVRYSPWQRVSRYSRWALSLHYVRPNYQLPPRRK